MKNIFLAIALFLAGISSAFGSDANIFTLNPSSSTCTQVFAEDGTNRAVVGGAVGAAGGAIAGRMLSRKGTMLGGLVGAGAGALIGHATREKVYNCKMTISVDDKTYLVHHQSPKKISVFDRIKVMKVSEGQYEVLE